MSVSPLPGVPLTREAADQVLATLRPTHDRIAAAMYALDSHPGLAYLRGSGLTGTSAQVARDVQELIALLWAQFTELGQHLERAKETRAARSRPGSGELATLTRLLRDPVVALGEDGIPVDGTGAAAKLVTLPELARALESSTTGLADLLTEVDTAVSTVAGQLAAATDALGEVRMLAASLDPDGDGGRLAKLVDVAGLTAGLDEVRAQGLADPIEVARGGAAAAAVADRLRRLKVEIDAARRRLDEVVRAREQHSRLLVELRTAVDTVAASQVEAARSHQLVRVKIANPGLPEVPATAADLRGRLARLDALVAEGRWPRFADELAALEHAVTEAQTYAVRLRAAADGLMERRSELRGRLDAYRAKAARLGYGEHQALSAVHREAHGLLYTSPCDLPAATRAVFRYQQSLADLTGKGTAR